MKLSIKQMLVSAVMVSTVLVVSGCNHDDDDAPALASYEITLTNLTNAQPLSPPIWVFHGDGYMPWQVGVAATAGLEMLAESGDSSSFGTEADAHSEVYSTSSSSALVTPGASMTYTVMLAPQTDLQLSLATMLVNTNDAFTGLNAVAIASLGSGDEQVIYAGAYDAGTEENLETAATIPGPAGGGEGFNAVRESSDQVTMHSGVVTMSDGLSSSALDQSHRFDNPVARVVIKRL
ncbi:MAG: spondin domain-containing protein [Pseudomonadales bacterium]|nr:spondin domain-containing protein [Pseudomonadales bacterium]